MNSCVISCRVSETGAERHLEIGLTSENTNLGGGDHIRTGARDGDELRETVK